MKFIILVLVCFFCGHHSLPLEGSEPVLINSKAEQIPEVVNSIPPKKNLNTGPLIISTTAASTTTILTTPSSITIPKTTPTVSTTSVTTKSPQSSTNPPTLAPNTPSSTAKTSPPSSSEPPTTPQSSPKPSTTLHTTSTADPNSRPTNQPIASSTSTIPTNRGFDGPSFIGGIVLAAGLMAIGFVAFKFYKARTELNYHTL